MNVTIREFAALAEAALEAIAIVIILLAVVTGSISFIRDGVRRRNWAAGYRRSRANLGRGILLGLELLVAADIIATIAAPLEFRTIGLLGLLVLIRTFLSFALEVEIEGRWPWRGPGVAR